MTEVVFDFVYPVIFCKNGCHKLKKFIIQRLKIVLDLLLLRVIWFALESWEMFCSIFLLEAFSDWCLNRFMEPVLCRSFQATCWLCNLPVMLGFWIQRSNSLFQPCILAETVIYYSIKSNLLLLFPSSSEVFQKPSEREYSVVLYPVIFQQ